MIKRLLDVAGALSGLLLLSPLLALIAVAILLDCGPPIFFQQARIGRGMRPFRILKFRTMTDDPSRSGPQLTTSSDPRLTRVGRVLCRLKIDELPQLLNVLLGDMSLVGPRPEVPRYVEMFRRDYAEILAVRPGMTDPASLLFRDEERLLQAAADPEIEYVRSILPRKIALSKEYARTRSLRGDLALILTSAALLLGFAPRGRRVS